MYVDSRDDNSKMIETTLRDTYGLPLVAFYVDKIPNSASVTHLLSELTGHEGLPYFFVCGTFIGGIATIRSRERYAQQGTVVVRDVLFEKMPLF